MLIEINTLRTKEIRKYAEKINQFYEKQKSEKINSILSDLIGYLKDENSDLCRDSIYILSLLIEDYLDILQEKLEKKLQQLINSSNTEIRLNTVIIWGNIIKKKLNSNEIINGEEIDKFINMAIDEKIPEIQANMLFIVEEFPLKYFDYIIPKINDFLEILKINNIEGIFDTILKILQYIWNRTLILKILVFNFLKQLYLNEKDFEKRDKILNFLSNGIPHLKELITKYRQNNKDFTEKDFINYVNDRFPFVKVYDIQKIAKDEKMSVDEAEQKFNSIKCSDEIFNFFYYDKKKYFIEVELKPLLNLLQDKKTTIEDLIKIFDDASFDLIACINVLIKSLVKSKLIKGYLGKSHFYSYTYLKNLLIEDLKKEGKINLDEYAKTINYNFLLEIINDISKETKLNGIFTKNKSEFRTISSIIKEIEKICIKESIYDLLNYKTIYSEQDFNLIEEECKKNLFTSYHVENKWLTNIGLTRITNACKNGQIIGLIDSNKISAELNIPQEIVLKIIEQYIENKPGIWDKSHSIYYFISYIKQKIKIIQSIEDENKRKQMVNNIAKELNVSVEEIEQKLKQEKEEIIQQIKNKPSIDIGVYTRTLGMKKEEFIEFINSLKIEYVIEENQMIFDKKRINKKWQDIRNGIIKMAQKDYELRISELSRHFNISEKAIMEIINSLYDIKSRERDKIKGILVDPDLFITTKGIKHRILQSSDYISPETVIPERPLTKEEEYLVVKILEDVIKSGELSGIYDEKTHIFKSDDTKVLEDYVKSKFNVEDIVEAYTNYMYDIYKKIKNIVLEKDDLYPGDINKVNYLIKNTIEKFQNWEHNLKESINSMQKSLENLESINEDLTFDDILDFKEEKVKKIDADQVMQKFLNWKQLIYDLEQNIPLIINVKKKLLDNPDDENLLKNLDELYEKVQFNTEKISFKKKK